MKKAKGTVFVEHIQSHLKEDQSVICKICGKSVERIYEEWKREGAKKQ